MSLLKGKKILLSVTGSIAAYKSPNLVRLLIKEGAEVKVILSEAAATLVSPLTLSTVSKNPVNMDFSLNHDWNNHVALAYWADLIIVAPASANTLAKMANGICNSILDAVYLSAKCDIMFAPAMDADMWEHPAVQYNVQKLKNFSKHHYIPTENGELASGLVGWGRMAEPETILQYVFKYFASQVTSENQLVAIVSAGPTFEALDPVRYIGNYSSGKMGIAIAKALAQYNFKVHLICGPHVEQVQYINIHQEYIQSAIELKDTIDSYFDKSLITVMSAAVADFRPLVKAENKIKKSADQDTYTIELTKNPDILKGLGEKKTDQQIVIGFALETQDELSYAMKKLQTKNADYIALNSLNDEGVGFGKDTNKITLLSKNAEPVQLPLSSKDEIAVHLITHILKKEGILNDE